MSEKERIKWLKLTLMKKEVFAIVSVICISIVANTIITGIMIAPLYHYEPTKAKVYDVRATLRIEHWSDDIQFVELPLKNVFIDDQYNGFMIKEEYLFVNNNTSLNATFHHIYLVVSIPQEAYEYFWEIEIQWGVEDHVGIVKKSTKDFSFNGFDYLTDIDITKEMNKDDVPETVVSQVTLFNR